MECLHISCDKCGYENPGVAKYCSECGNFLWKACPYCETPNRRTAVFCSECGLKLISRCLDCGFINVPGQKFCGNCRKQLVFDNTILKPFRSVEESLPLPPIPTAPVADDESKFTLGDEIPSSKEEGKSFSEERDIVSPWEGASDNLHYNPSEDEMGGTYPDSTKPVETNSDSETASVAETAKPPARKPKRYVYVASPGKKEHAVDILPQEAISVQAEYGQSSRHIEMPAHEALAVELQEFQTIFKTEPEIAPAFTEIKQERPALTETNAFPNLFPEQPTAGQPSKTISKPVENGILQPIAQKTAGLSHLESFALLSIELMNLKEIMDSVADPKMAEHYRLECLHFIEQRALTMNAKVESVKRNIVFISFPHAETLWESIVDAAEMSLNLLKETIRLQKYILVLRIGLDIENAGERNAMISVTERSIARAGMLVVSENALPYLDEKFTLDPIGPLRIGQRMQMFYHVVKHRPNILPHEAEGMLLERQSATIALENTAGSGEVGTPEPSAILASVSGIAPKDGTGSEYYTAEDFIRLYLSSLPEYLRQGSPRPPTQNYEQAVETLIAEVNRLFLENSAKTGQILFLSASPGLGKTYIVQYVRTQTDPDMRNPKAFWLGAHNYASFSSDYFPLFYWVELIYNFLGLPREGVSRKETQSVLENTLHYIYDTQPPQEVTAFFRDILLTADMPHVTMAALQNFGRAADYFLDLFRVLAGKKPVIIILEDLDAADYPTVEFWFTLLNRGLLDLNVTFIVTLSRDIYLEESLSRQLSRFPSREIVIADLNQVEAERFLNTGPLAEHVEALPFEVYQKILRNAKGLPLYLVECLRLLHLQGVLRVDSQTCKLTFNEEANVNYLNPPASVEEVIRTRLTLLPDFSRYLLQLAAVLGERFSVSILMQASRSPEEEFNPALEELWNQGFITPDMTNSARFVHSVIWQVVYREIAADAREKMHGLVGEMLEYAWHEQHCVHPSFIAFHSEQSHRYDKAFQAWHLAGVYASQFGSLSAFNQCWINTIRLTALVSQEALQTASQTGGPGAQAGIEEFETGLIEFMGLFNLEPAPDFALPLLYQAVLRAQRKGHKARQLEALSYLGAGYERIGDFQKSLNLQDEALSLISKTENPQEYAALLVGKLSTFFTLGRLQQAKQLIEKEVEVFFSSQLPLKESVYLNAYLNARRIKANIQLMQYDSQAFRTLDECLGFAQENDVRELILSLKLLRCQGFLAKGSYESCSQSLQNLLQEIESYGPRSRFLTQWAVIAMAYHCEIGDWENAALLIPNALYQAEQLHDPAGAVSVNLYAARISYGGGHYREAKNMLETAIQHCFELHTASLALTGWRFLAEVEMAMGNFAAAQEMAYRALDIANKPEIQYTEERYLLSLVYADALLRQAHIKPAGKLLESLWPEVGKAGFDPLTAKTAAMIGNLYAAMAKARDPLMKEKHNAQARSFYEKSRTLWLNLQNAHYLRQADALIASLS